MHFTAPVIDWRAVANGADTVAPITRRLLSGRRRLPWKDNVFETDSVVDPAWLADVGRYIQGLSPGALLTLYAYTSQDYGLIQDFVHGDERYGAASTSGEDKRRHGAASTSGEDKRRYIEELVIPEDFATAAVSWWSGDAFAKTWTRAGVLERYGLPRAEAVEIRRTYAASRDVDTEAAFVAWSQEWARRLEAARSRFTAAFWKAARRACVADQWGWHAHFAWAAVRALGGNAAHPYSWFKSVYGTLTAAQWRAILTQYVADLDAVFAAAPPLQRALTVFRGTPRRTRRWSRGFVSTTLKLAAAEDFRGADGCCLHKLRVAPGARVLPLFMITRYSAETEILLPRGLMRS